MTTFYVTFGQRSPFRNGWVEINAPNEEVARVHAFDILGAKWGHMYDRQPSLALFHLGRLGEPINAKSV